MTHVFILDSVEALMNSTGPAIRERRTIPPPSQLCCALSTCFLLQTSLKILWNTSSFVLGTGKDQRAFTQTILWMGGMTVSFNPLETQFSLITGCVHTISSMQFSCLNSSNWILFIISATQSYPRSKNTCASTTYLSYTFVSHPINILLLVYT